MNIHRVLRIPMIELVIVALILLAASVGAILMAVVWPLIHVPSSQAPVHADPLEVVNDFHVAINSNNVDGTLALFADDATITDNGSIIKGKEQIRNWALYSQHMAGLHLTMFRSEMDGEEIIWLDTAYNGPEVQHRHYILRWEAVIQEGKIQSLMVLPRYKPDLK